MSYGVMAYVVNTKSLMDKIKDDLSFTNIIKKKLFSSQGYCDALIAKCSYIFPEIDEVLQDTDQGHDGVLNAKLLMEELLDGRAHRKEFGFAYAYLFKSICEVLGDFLDNDKWSPCDIQNIYDIPFTSQNLPFQFPEPDDFPIVFRIKPESINLDAVEYKSLNSEQIEQLKYWYTEAVDYNLDIFLFLH